MSIATPFSRPLYVMSKAAGPHCNLACTYCYYLEKAKLYPEDPRHIMSDELLELFVRQYIEAQTAPEILFTWHGGEPLMRPLSFYKKAMELQQYYGKGRIINNCIQTNGTLLNDEWCKFFHDNGWLVGISIDGPQEFHDEYRRTRDGKPTFNKVKKGIDLLNKYQVEWNGMAVVNDFNADYPLDFYHFFRDNGCKYLQFTPIVERISQHTDGRHLAHLGEEELPIADFSVTPEQWGKFLIAIFDEWVKNDVGQVFVELFDCFLANWCGVAPGICVYAKECGHAGVMEYNGDVYSCDHFVFPEYKLGNIQSKTLTEMLYGDQQNKFSELKHKQLPQFCKSCAYEFVCHGECPKNRFAKTPDGEKGLNYLCGGYYQFFEHVAPAMEFMKNEYMNQRPPANIMEAIRNGIVKLK